MHLSEASPTPALLEVDDLVVDFPVGGGRVRVVDGVSFRVDAGETLAVLGESGSGKSVTSLAMMGLLPSAARRVQGDVRLSGQSLVSLSSKEMQRLRGARIAMVFQDPLSALNPVLSVGYQIGEVLWRRGATRKRNARSAVIELMERVQIPDARRRLDAYPHQFSGGMRQRLLIAMALALEPEVLIADEPTTALDVTVQKQILDLLGEIQREEGMAMVLVTHDLGVVAGHADRVAVMYGGRIVETGPIRDVYTSPAHPYTEGLMNSVPTLDGSRGRLMPVPGSPPDPRHMPTGCNFHPRCAQARGPVCEQQVPALRDVAVRRRSACHFAEEVMKRG